MSVNSLKYEPTYLFYEEKLNLSSLYSMIPVKSRDGQRYLDSRARKSGKLG